MNKPNKPNKKILVSNSKTFDFDHASKKVSLLYFLEWAQKSIPKDAEDVTLELFEDVQYDGNDGNLTDIYTSLVIAWKEYQENTSYEKQMKKYEKKFS